MIPADGPASDGTRLRVLSLGAGVQSTTLALMAAAGEVGPMPDCAIFADTQWEPRAVYDHLEWLCGMLPFPVHRVTAGSIREDAIAKSNSTGQRFASVPWFTRDAKGKKGMGRRQCTKEYKLRPIQKKVVELLGGRFRRGAEMWIGISVDEAMRMRPSRVQYIVNRHPLIEAGLSRRDCLAWMDTRGYPRPPKSACIGCPYHNDAMWRDMKDNDPGSWVDALIVDAAIRTPSRGMRREQFMHRQCVPLADVDLRTHGELGQPDLFIDECEGMCGV